MVEVTRKQLAEIRSCHPLTVDRAELPRTPDKKYDLTNSLVMDFVVKNMRDNWIREHRASLKPASPEGDLEGDGSLDDELKKENIAFKSRQSRKLDLEHEVKKKLLIPVELVKAWIGYFSSGIRNNFLSIGNRVARGNDALRDRIENEIARSIQRTIDNAEASMRKDLKK